MASLPVISIIAMMWIYIDTKDIEKISLLSKQLSWMVLPSLIFFISLPIFLKHGFSFYSGLTSSMILTATGYCAMILIIKQIGFKIWPAYSVTEYWRKTVTIQKGIGLTEFLRFNGINTRRRVDYWLHRIWSVHSTESEIRVSLELLISDWKNTKGFIDSVIRSGKQIDTTQSTKILFPIKCCLADVPVCFSPFSTELIPVKNRMGLFICNGNFAFSSCNAVSNNLGCHTRFLMIVLVKRTVLKTCKNFHLRNNLSFDMISGKRKIFLRNFCQ